MMCTGDDLRAFEALVERIGRAILHACARGELVSLDRVLLDCPPEVMASALRAARALAASRPPPAVPPL